MAIRASIPNSMVWGFKSGLLSPYHARCNRLQGFYRAKKNIDDYNQTSFLGNMVVQNCCYILRVKYSICDYTLPYSTKVSKSIEAVGEGDGDSRNEAKKCGVTATGNRT